MGATLYPLDNRVVVEPLEKAELTPGGIALPDSARATPDRAKVVRVGPGLVLDSGARAEVHILPGQTVVFPPRAGVPVESGGKKYVVLRESEILAVESDG